jgi:GTP-binding protein EngB required for normal cell division
MTTIVGIVGPIGSGKSTMINQVFGVEIRGEVNGNTVGVHYYDIGDNLVIMDFPGSDSAFYTARQNAQNHMNVPSAFMVLIDGGGSATSVRTTACRDIIDAVVKTGKPFVIIFTQMDRRREKDLKRHKEGLIDAIMCDEIQSEMMRKAKSDMVDDESPKFPLISFASFQPESGFPITRGDALPKREMSRTLFPCEDPRYDNLHTAQDVKKWIQFIESRIKASN